MRLFNGKPIDLYGVLLAFQEVVGLSLKLRKLIVLAVVFVSDVPLVLNIYGSEPLIVNDIALLVPDHVVLDYHGARCAVLVCWKNEVIESINHGHTIFTGDQNVLCKAQVASTPLIILNII